MKHKTKRGCARLREYIFNEYHQQMTDKVIRKIYSVHLSSVAQSCLTLGDTMDCILLGSSVQARIPEWVAMPSSRGSSWPRDWTHVSYVSHTGSQVLYHWCHMGFCFVYSFVLAFSFLDSIHGWNYTVSSLCLTYFT